MKRLAICLSLLLLSAAAAFAADTEAGYASWYTSDVPGALTANGDTFDPNSMSAAHKTLKFGTRVQVTNRITGKSIEVRINDRGPYVDGRIIDLTPKAAEELGMKDDGVAPVTLSVLYEPEVPESRYNRPGDTGWYKYQILSTSNVDTALALYERLSQAGLRPYAEQTDGGLVRITVRWVPRYRRDQTRQTLTSLGINVSQTLEMSEENPLLYK